MPATGSPSMLKGYHNSLIDGSPSILVTLLNSEELFMTGRMNRWGTCNRYTWHLQDCSKSELPFVWFGHLGK